MLGFGWLLQKSTLLAQRRETGVIYKERGLGGEVSKRASERGKKQFTKMQLLPELQTILESTTNIYGFIWNSTLKLTILCSTVIIQVEKWFWLCRAFFLYPHSFAHLLNISCRRVETFKLGKKKWCVYFNDKASTKRYFAAFTAKRCEISQVK